MSADAGTMEAVLERFVAPKPALALCLAVSAGLIAGAHAFERIGGMIPCLLCLDQREAHWTALGVGVLLLALTKLQRPRLVAAGLGGLALIYLFSAGVAGYHVGVEWGWWPGPAGCAVGGPDVDTSDILGSLNEPGPAGPSCSEAAWRMLGLSMAGYNALISAGLAIVAGAACAQFARRMDRRAVHA